MSHLVKPVSFRVGKTFPWYSNTLLANKKLIGGSLTLSKGLSRISRILLKRKRFYTIRGAIAGKFSGKIKYRLLYVPKIKVKPREKAIGWFMRKALYKPVDWLSKARSIAKRYVYNKQEKIARRRRKSKPKQLNRWLTRRMFRGSHRLLLKRRDFLVKKCIKKRKFTKFGNTLLLSRLPGERVKKFFEKTFKIAAISRNTRKLYRKYTFRKIYWKKKWVYDKIRGRRLNDRRFSSLVTRLTYQPVKIQSINVFAYLESKRAINYKTHQNHFWNYRYRRYRFQYKNYYDIANSFLVISLLDHCEDFLLTILKITLPVILKIKKFFRFLSKIISYMPELREKFSLFRMNIAGKLAGGTKRTKAHGIGYGVLDVQTLGIITYNNFFSYRHIYGEFGVKLLMRKDIEHSAVRMLA